MEVHNLRVKQYLTKTDCTNNLALGNENVNRVDVGKKLCESNNAQKLCSNVHEIILGSEIFLENLSV